MKALISTIEPRETGYRVAQVVEDGATFMLAEGMFWADFPDNLDSSLVPLDRYWYDNTGKTINLVPLNTVENSDVSSVSSTESLY
jgi:hypothetical protein